MVELLLLRERCLMRSKSMATWYLLRQRKEKCLDTDIEMHWYIELRGRQQNQLEVLCTITNLLETCQTLNEWSSQYSLCYCHAIAPSQQCNDFCCGSINLLEHNASECSIERRQQGFVFLLSVKSCKCIKQRLKWLHHSKLIWLNMVL